MGRHKKYDGPTEFIGGRIRQDCYSDLLESLGRQPIQQFLDEAVEAKVEKFRRQKEIESMINESANKDVYNSPLRTALSIRLRQTSPDRDISRSANDKPAIEMIEQMFLTPFDEIVKNNMDDVDYMKKILRLLKKRYEFVSGIIAEAEGRPKTDKWKSISEAIERDRARRNREPEPGNDKNNL
jgi:hypothetical protein